MADDYYTLLGVALDADDKQIKRAFREIARACHPDVAGPDPLAEQRFKDARKAYETLMDPVARARYDRRGERRAPAGGGSFFDAFYRTTGQRMDVRAEAGRTRPSPGGPAPRNANAVGLDDLFNDFGFGARTPVRERATSPPPAPQHHVPTPGEDVHVNLDVPAHIAAAGGSLTAVYDRLQRADSWRPGSTGAGLVRVQDIADIRILPATATGEVLRERGLGHAGSHGGAYGDLVVTVRVVGRVPTPAPEPPSTPEPTAPEPIPHATVDLSIVEAMLGGRVAVGTPTGNVRITVPPGTSSGARLRLKGRGPPDAAGAPTDWFVVTRIVVPKVLDAESRLLIEAYARLNPAAPDPDAV